MIQYALHWRAMPTCTVWWAMAIVKNNILELFKLDSRGVFDNDVLEYGLSDAYDAAVQRRSSSSEKSRAEYVTETGYVLRIMLAHAKIKAKLAANALQKTPGATLSETLHPLWLQEVYKLMETSIGEAGRPKAKSHGKNAPLTKRPCVFVNYRPFFEQQKAGDSSDSESSGHEPMDPLQEMVNDMAVVAKEYDSKRCKAIIRFSNGFQLPAATHEETDTGFLRAVWPATGEVLQLEVPNVQLVDGKIKPDCPAPPNVLDGTISFEAKHVKQLEEQMKLQQAKQKATTKELEVEAIPL